MSFVRFICSQKVREGSLNRGVPAKGVGPAVLLCLVAGFLLISPPAQAAMPPGSGYLTDFWHLGLNSTSYVFETGDLAGGSTTHYQGYHRFSGMVSGMGGGRFLLRGNGRLANDLHLRPQGFDTSRLYNGYLEARVTHTLRARLGRQWVLGGGDHLTLDGAWLSWRPSSRLHADFWGGARAPLAGEYEAGSLDEDAAIGGRLVLRKSARLRLEMSLGHNERGGVTAQVPLGILLAGSPQPRTVQTHARLVYDLENEFWSRLQAQLRWRPRSSPTSVALQFVDRRPFIDPGSFFYRFAEVERIRVARGSLRYEKDSGFGAELETFGSFVDEHSASRLGVALLVPGGRLGYSVRLGDQGEENRFFGEYARQLKSWLRAEGEATFQTYALFNDAPASAERELVTLAGRLRMQLRPGLRILTEIQSLDNPLYSKDIRFLCGVDLARSGGTADTGLGRGGWLR